MRRLAVALTALLLLAGCATPAEPEATERPLTTEEAQRLAAGRFLNFDAGTRTVSVDLAESDQLHFEGWVDFSKHQGYGLLTEPDEAGESLLLRWDLTAVAVHDAPSSPELFPVPADGWTTGSLDPGSDPLHNVLAVLLSLGSDRPDNPTLLQQTDALWLREDSIDGTPVDVFAGPSSDTPATESSAPNPRTVLYWVDDDGRMLRVEIAASADEYSRIDLGDSQSQDLGTPPSEGLAP